VSTGSGTAAAGAEAFALADFGFAIFAVATAFAARETARFVATARGAATGFAASFDGLAARALFAGETPFFGVDPAPAPAAPTFLFVAMASSGIRK
jgi:hypothetical protein